MLATTCGARKSQKVGERHIKMARKLGYKPAVGKTGPGSLKMKAGKPGPVGKEKAAPIHAPAIMKKAIDDMRKQKGKKGISGGMGLMTQGTGY